MSRLGSLILITFCVGFHSASIARDVDGRFANSPLKPWFDSLKSGKGPCCSDADGTAVADPDWRSKDGHYQVRLPSFSGVGDYNGPPEWIDVPDDAVITEPNRAGRTMVWPIRGYMGTTIRCFLPGSMT
jgi:hypothetical protein